MKFDIPTTESIHKTMLRDYHAELDLNQYQDQPVDPVLNSLMRVFASRMAELYADHEKTRLAILDELIEGLSVIPRRATPAQTVLRFTPPDGQPVQITEEDELLWQGNNGQVFRFVCDCPFRLSKAQIALAFVYQNRSLSPFCENQWSRKLTPAQESAAAEWGDGPSLLFALEDLPAGTLNGLSIFFDISQNARDYGELQHMMARSIWRVADKDGKFGPTGYFSPETARGGVMKLRHSSARGADREEAELADPVESDISGGFYAGNTFLFPIDEPKSAESQPVCSGPRGLESAIEKLFPRDKTVTAAPRTWVRISLRPEGGAASKPLAMHFNQVQLHAMSLSNVTRTNQSPALDVQGSSIAIKYPGADEFIAGLRAIHEGRRVTPIVPLLDSAAPPDLLRYSVREGRVEVKLPGGAETAAGRVINVRAWSTAGARANGLPGTGLGKEWPLKPGLLIKMILVKSPAGGRDEEDRSSAEARFAAAIQCRGRIVTQADLERTVRAWDSRIVKVETTPEAARRGQQARMFYRLKVVFSFAAFPESLAWYERDVICRELKASLRSRLPFDMDVEIDAVWDGRSHPEADE